MLDAVTETPSEPVGPPEPAEQGADDAGQKPNIHQVQAAAFADLADDFATMSADLAQTLSGVKPVFTGPGAEQAQRAVEELMSAMPRETQTMADQLLLAGRAHAAMSFAYEELMASGGPDNPETLARYEEADRWYRELVNAERPEGDIPPMS